MNVQDAIRERRSVRAWQDRPVEDEKLEAALQAARLAPSARNRQEWKFVVVRDEAVRERLSDGTRGQEFVCRAPVVIVGCALEHNYTMSCGHRAFTIDLAIALQQVALQARELGLGSCWIGAFDHDTVRQALDIPKGVQVVGLMPLGYPQEWPEAKPRKAIEQVVCYDAWED
jgi:nitroreductase